MKFYKTFILIVITLSLVGYLIFYRYGYEKKLADAGLFKIRRGEITGIAIRNNFREEIISLKRTLDRWKIMPRKSEESDEAILKDKNRDGFDAGNFFINAMVDSISNLVPHRKLVFDESKVKEYGFDKPSMKVSFVVTDGDIKTFLIGKKSVFGGNVYVHVSDGGMLDFSKGVFLCDYSLLRTLDKSLYELRSKELISLRKDDVKRVSLKTGGSRRIVLQHSLIGWSIVEPLVDSVNELEMNRFLLSLTTTRVKKILVDNYTQKHIEKYGLERPSLSLEIESVKNNEKVRIAFSNHKNKFFMSNSRKEFIAEVEEEVFSGLYKGLKDFRDNKIAHFNRWEVSKIEIQVSGFVTTSTGGGSQWKTRQRYVDSSDRGDPVEVPIEKHEIDSFLDLLLSQKVEDFVSSGKTPDLKRYGLLEPSPVISIFSKGKDGKEKLAVRIYVGNKYTKKGKDSEKFYYAGLQDKSFVYGISSRVISSIPGSYTRRYRSRKSGAKTKLLEKTGSTRKLKRPFTKDTGQYRAVILTEKGAVDVELFHRTAPYTVSNFLNLARNGFYNKMKFHRVIPGFLVQTGDPTGTGKGGPGYHFKDEISSRKHLRGTLSMARTTEPGTNGSQFFICLSPQPHLDNVNTIFGRVTGGLRVLDSLKENDLILSVKVYEIQE